MSNDGLVYVGGGQMGYGGSNRENGGCYSSPPQPPTKIERTEKQTIDALGEWLCKQLELDVAKDGKLLTEASSQHLMIRDIAKKIRWYRDNCLDS